jgi:hypothetical protein
LWYLFKVLLPIVRAAWIARDSLDDESDEVVRTLSISSMAGMMVARLGVLREKNRVASLKTYAKQCEWAIEETEKDYSP